MFARPRCETGGVCADFSRLNGSKRGQMLNQHLTSVCFQQVTSGTPPDITISAEIDDLLLWFVVVWLIRQGLHCVEVFARVVNANLLFFNV